MEKLSSGQKEALSRLACEKLDHIANEINKQMFDGLRGGIGCRETWIRKNCKLQQDLHTLEMLFRND